MSLGSVTIDPYMGSKVTHKIDRKSYFSEKKI